LWWENESHGLEKMFWKKIYILGKMIYKIMTMFFLQKS
jgi:hypothetical protein